jgi:hypothetical protein
MNLFFFEFVLNPLSMILRKLFLFFALVGLAISCKDENAPIPDSISVNGTILDATTNRPVANVNIFGFKSGVSVTDGYPSFGERVKLGSSGSDGKFKLEISKEYRGVTTEGIPDDTHLMLEYEWLGYSGEYKTFSFESQTVNVPLDHYIFFEGTILDSENHEPVENVNIIGFEGGTHTNNLGTTYGEQVVLGTSDKCGRFRIKIPREFKGSSAHGWVDTVYVVLEFKRQDYGSLITSVPFENHQQNITMDFNPPPNPFFSNLSLLISEDKSSVEITWAVYALTYTQSGPGYPYPCPCRYTSDGSVYIGRSDQPGVWIHTEPIDVNVQKSFNDTNLPSGPFSYTIYPGDDHAHYFTNIPVDAQTQQVIEVYKLPAKPVLNHCQ